MAAGDSSPAKASCGKYDLSGLLVLGIYLIITFVLGDISVKLLLKRMRIVLGLVCLMGIANPFFDREAVLILGGFAVTGGMVSAATLAVKGVFAVSASYLLIVTTSVEDICYALRALHVPKIFALRAPGQKGLNQQVWGTFAGQLLLRSMDRAQTVYDSMMMRGYNGEFYLRCKRSAERGDYLYAAGWSTALLLIRIIHF